MSFLFTDTNGSKYRVWMRAAYAHIITNAKELKAAKAKCVMNRRICGYEIWANETAKQTIMRWADDQGLISKSIRKDQ